MRKINSIHLKKYLEEQRNEILKYKWIRSEEACHNIGNNQAAFEWIEKYAKLFRDSWEFEDE